MYDHHVVITDDQGNHQFDKMAGVHMILARIISLADPPCHETYSDSETWTAEASKVDKLLVKWISYW